MVITSQPFVRFTSFNYWVAALAVLYHLTPIAGPITTVPMLPPPTTLSTPLLIIDHQVSSTI